MTGVQTCALPIYKPLFADPFDYDGDGVIAKDERHVKDPDRGGIIHVYPNPQGTKTGNTPLFTIGGWSGTPIPYYSGGNSGLIFHYSNGITIEFVHAGTNNANLRPNIPANPGSANRAEIGFIGGAGGDSSSNYNHTHIVFFSNKAKGIRIDPRTLFCGW